MILQFSPTGFNTYRSECSQDEEMVQFFINIHPTWSIVLHLASQDIDEYLEIRQIEEVIWIFIYQNEEFQQLI